MKQRIYYIDCIKGLAILLVVMGHVIGNWYDDFYALKDNDIDDQLLLFNIIYSFHMPLFMFCSGLFQPVITRDQSIKSVLGIVWRRFKVLMIPYFFSGLLFWFFTGRPDFYWFLLILFEFIVINLFASTITCRIRKWGDSLEIILFLIIFILIRLLFNNGMAYEKLPLIDIGHLGLYCYFTVGYLVSKYNLLERYIDNHSNIYTVAIVIFISLFSISVILPGVNVPLSGRLIPFAAIYIIFYIFKNKIKAKNYISRSFGYLGRHTLDIYILHSFFLVKLPFIGDVIHSLSLSSGTAWGGVIIGICFSLAISVVILAFCFLIWQLIRPSDILSQLFLGRTYGNKDI